MHYFSKDNMTIEHNPNNFTSILVCFNRHNEQLPAINYPIFKYQDYYYATYKNTSRPDHYTALNIMELAREILGNYGRYDIYISFGYLELLEKESVELYDRIQELREECKLWTR